MRCNVQGVQSMLCPADVHQASLLARSSLPIPVRLVVSSHLTRKGDREIHIFACALARVYMEDLLLKAGMMDCAESHRS
jgi:hypothetical protein